MLAFRLLDPRETELPDIGPVFLEDSESGAQLYFDTHDPRLRRRFAAAAARREKRLADAFRAAGVDALTLSTEDDLPRELLRFAGLRRGRRRQDGRGRG